MIKLLQKWWWCWTDTQVRKCGWVRRKSCGCPGALLMTMRTLNARFLTSDTVCKLACTSMALSLTTAPLIDNHFCVSSSRHIYKALSILLRDTLCTYTRNIHMQCNTGLSAFPDFANTFLDKTNWFVYTKMLSNHSNAHSLPIYPICSLSITDITIPFFLPQPACQHIHLAF